MTIDRRTHAISRSGQYWAFAHLSRHVRRGARVLETTGSLAGVSHVAFENPDGSRVVVLASSGNAATTQRVVLEGQATDVSLPPDSVTTLSWAVLA